MRLCFGTFAKVLLDNGKNKSVSKGDVGMELLAAIDPLYNPELSYAYKLVDRKRELAAGLIEAKPKTSDLRERFVVFADRYLSLNHEKIFSDFSRLIFSDSSLSAAVKAELVCKVISLKEDLPLFLAEIFSFVVEHTTNIPAGEADVEELPPDNDNVAYAELAKLALRDENAEVLDFAMRNMTNHVYMARALIALAHDIGCMDQEIFRDIFHRELSRMANNIYRGKVFAGCLLTGYFEGHPDDLLERHFYEFTNDRYVYDTLVFLYNHGLQELAEKYAGQLTNEAYIKRWEEFVRK